MERDANVEELSSLRKVGCEQSFLSRPDGSATFTHGNTSVMAAVYGPADVNQRKEILDKATVEVILKNKVGFAGVKEKAQERLIRNGCETAILTGLHPRTSITIVLQIIQDAGSVKNTRLEIQETMTAEGDWDLLAALGKCLAFYTMKCCRLVSLLSCCINAACMALLDAGIPMKYLIAAVTCVLDKDGQLILDPTEKQAREAQCTHTFAFESQGKKIITSATKGTCTSEQYQSCLASCQTASEEILNFYRTSIERKLSKT